MLVARAAKADKIESWKIDFIKLNLALTTLISLECETAAEDSMYRRTLASIASNQEQMSLALFLLLM